MQDTATINGKKLTASKVLAACVEHDRLGRNAFLDRYGFRRASRWHLRVNGRSYPSKAIVGVATGMKPADFFGGVRGAVQALATLGFNVRNSETGEKADPKLDSLRRFCEREGLDVREPEWPNRLGVMPTAYFASGSNQPNQIRALGKAGADIGVAVPHVSKNAEAELVALAGSDVQVFVDSGAFSEVKFGPEGVEVVKPMKEDDWDKVLGLYERLAAALGSQVWVVAPDMVGNQEVSINRIARYAERVKRIRALGARILVPVQKGVASQLDYARAVDVYLGQDWIPALPCKKAATTAAEVLQFVRARRPRHVHLLGLGVRSPKLTGYSAAFQDGATSYSLDSCWITANVGRGRGRLGRLTRAQDVAKLVLAATGATVAHVELAIYCCFAGPGLVS